MRLLHLLFDLDEALRGRDQLVRWMSTPKSTQTHRLLRWIQIPPQRDTERHLSLALLCCASTYAYLCAQSYVQSYDVTVHATPYFISSNSMDVYTFQAQMLASAQATSHLSEMDIAQSGHESRTEYGE